MTEHRGDTLPPIDALRRRVASKREAFRTRQTDTLVNRQRSTLPSRESQTFVYPTGARQDDGRERALGCVVHVWAVRGYVLALRLDTIPTLSESGGGHRVEARSLRPIPVHASRAMWYNTSISISYTGRDERPTNRPALPVPNQCLPLFVIASSGSCFGASRWLPVAGDINLGVIASFSGDSRLQVTQGVPLPLGPCRNFFPKDFPTVL
ncbi:hypothetical protein BC827DRAFT_1153535 [Russula dissimulans]|nr:hypothetical protein BC827DRAFT_1153535 [Russula dissimulans]